MLHHLRVANLGVLEEAEMEPGSGFTVITGETGAGKTMLLGALRLLKGEKPNTSAVGPFGDEARAEGLFGEDDRETGVTRIVPRDGKSRAYVDGNLAASSVLEERIGPLVEIVGQHDRLSLQRSRALLGLLDGKLSEQGRRARISYDEVWARFRSALDDQRRLGGDRMGLERELDLLRHQANEIAAAGLRPGDDFEMESMASRLRNAELFRENLSAAAGELESGASSAGEVVARLRKLAAIDPAVAGLAATAEGLDALVHDLIREVRELTENADEDPETLEQLERRLTELGELKRKYGRTLEDVLEFGADASRRVSELDLLIEQASTIDDLVGGLEVEVTAIGAELSAARRAAADEIEREVRLHLAALGLPTASVGLTIEPAEPGPTGADKLELWFASDDRLVSGRIQDVASGGELSRLMLSLRLATRSYGAGTMVFDEIDAGVGGATALALGRKLADLAQTRQVLCVTHLPQVAAHAGTHYVIERDGSRAEIRKVDDEDRLAEMSRMLAGLPESERGREAAAELLEGARGR